MREQIHALIRAISPYDDLEKQTITDAVNWIESEVEIFRIEKPDVPPKHLVSYFVVVDPEAKKILLMDHIKACLWLPSGGHVEKGEHPKTTVEREIQEELNINADFISELPIFLTRTVTVGLTAGHTDVSFWYVVKGDSRQHITFDTSEFHGYRWFGYEEVLAADPAILDPQMHRFTKKLLQSGLV
ncbi:MAG TPA: NUDIX hydrolase [Candidatus Paceibacterota bacterium]|jgi:8-oxo-dGTP pyrophosphatase MutT (NUDIX family)